jgi:hypothetical protein
MLQKILLGLFILSFFTASCQKLGEETIYLIPKNYEGNVLVIFDQPDGADTLYEGNRRVYKIDTTGVLKTKFKANYGIRNMDLYYAVDDAGNRTKLKYLTIVDTLRENNVVVCMIHETGNYFDKKIAAKVHFARFIVSTIAYSDSIANQRDNFMRKNLDEQ